MLVIKYSFLTKEKFSSLNFLKKSSAGASDMLSSHYQEQRSAPGAIITLIHNRLHMMCKIQCISFLSKSINDK